MISDISDRIKVSVAELEAKLSNSVDDVNLLKKQIPNHLTREKFVEHQNITSDSIKKLKESIDSLHSNINPCALLRQNNNPSSELLENTPNAFLQGLFDQFSVDINRVVKVQNEQLKHIESVINILKKNLNLHLYSAAKKAVTQLRGRGELAGSLSMEANGLFDSFQAAITKKCDFSELQSLNDLKANKSDLEQLQKFSWQISKQLKYAVVLLNEFMSILISNAKESKAEKMTKLSYVAYQLSLFYKSILIEQTTDNGEAIKYSNLPKQSSFIEERRTEEKTPAIKAKSTRPKTQSAAHSKGTRKPRPSQLKFSHQYYKTSIEKFCAGRNPLYDSKNGRAISQHGIDEENAM
eukprot:TRINITY_DN6784_c0_g1_i14.p1 TRINITY_DN6784_c0_g1~~TRINITY_DN6784_c0_g1_i14.p1  ORF type:complete len:352 (+),score=51.82 TRINITY_DN6784_c0_g1_i14:173-1228(+)